MQEHIVALFETYDNAVSAARALEGIGVPASAIRRYAADEANQTVRRPEHDRAGGGFWAWLLGEEGPQVTYAPDQRDGELYQQRVDQGATVLAVTVADDTLIHRAVEIIEAHDPVEIEEETEEDRETSGNTLAPVAPSTSSTTEHTAAVNTQQPASTEAIGTNREERIPLAEEELEVGKRTVDRGVTRIRRYVVETPVEREVSLHGQTVTIERRRPIDNGAIGTGAFEERVVEVRETQEVPVVSKTAHVAEEVVLHREDTERRETVRDTVRREEVEITPEDKTR
jgi:uncharacterized protein (TIGR02271 family)